MHAGVPLKLSSPVYQVMNGGTFPPDIAPQKRAMTLEHLLTMSSGYFCDDTNDDAPGNEDKMWDQEAEPDFYRYTMKVPLATPPGENAVYCSASPNLALGMTGRAAHENPMSLFDRLIGEPMKIRRYEWALDPAGNPYGGGGMSLLLRDFIKLGQLMLNGGTWEGRRVVSKDFVARASAPLYHLRNLYYGYLWWGEDYPYKNRTIHTFSARGSGGQTVTVVPELDLIVATFAGNFSSRKGMFAASTDPIPRIILPAVREPGDDKSAPVIEREYVTPYGASKDGSRRREEAVRLLYAASRVIASCNMRSSNKLSLRAPASGPPGHSRRPTLMSCNSGRRCSRAISQSTVARSSIPRGDSKPSILAETRSSAGKY
jgi:CubicO group peptidase (beta-lactamase class C family)